MGKEPATWLAALGREVGNLRAALSWAFDADQEPGDERVETGLRLANALARFWDTQGPDEGRRWLEKGLAYGAEVPPPVRAKALKEAGFVAVYEGDPHSIPMLTEALDLYKEIENQPGMLATVHNLGHALAYYADPETAATVKAEVKALLANSGDRNVAAHLAHFLGLAASTEKDFDEMRLRLKEALALYTELGTHATSPCASRLWAISCSSFATSGRQKSCFGVTAKPKNNSVTGNHFGRNRPDIFWDKSGTGNRFVGNLCDTSVPSSLCN